MKHLYETREISVRAYNTCKTLGIKNTHDLALYFQQNRHFRSAINCGTKTNQELIDFCNDKLGYPLATSMQPADLSDEQLDLVNCFIELKCESMSVRSQNSLIKFLNGKVDYPHLLKSLPKSEIQSIPGIGKHSAREIELLLQSVIRYTDGLKDDGDFLHRERIKLFMLRSHNISMNTEQAPESLLSAVNLVLSESMRFSAKERKILLSTFNIYDNFPSVAMATVAKQVKLSSERVRQLRIQLFTKLQIIIEELSPLNLLSNLNRDTDWIYVDSDMQSAMNSKSATKFSKQFIAWILSIELRNRFSPVCDPKEVILHQKVQNRTRHNWKNILLLSDTFQRGLMANDFADFVFEIQNQKRKTPLIIRLKELIPKITGSTSNLHKAPAAQLIRKLLWEEFNMEPDENDVLTFEPTAYRPVREYLYDILDKANRPLKLEEIINFLNAELPNKRIKPGSIRSALLHHPEVVSIGRKSMYGLKKWESEKSDFKGGTIGEIVIDYLSAIDYPAHIDAVVEEVLKFRPESNFKSIETILRVDQSGDIVFYNKGLVGLKSKTYLCGPNGELLTEKISARIKSWSQRYEELTAFCQKAERLPSSTGKTSGEPALHRWFKRQQNRSDLSQKKKELLTKIQSSFDVHESDARIAKRLRNLESLKLFVWQNGRLPDSRHDTEKKLYSVYYREKRNFEANKLYQKMKECFEEILSLI